MRHYKSFYKDVGGNEGDKCHYSVRLDSYGCGCQHDCSYCYAKSLLNFRGLWNPQRPSVADIRDIRKTIKGMDRKTVVRLGGMTDCFQPLERVYNVTYEVIKALQEHGQPYLIVTKSDMVADDQYMWLMDPKLAHIQVTVTCLEDDLYQTLKYEKAPIPSLRLRAIKKLQENGFDVQLRLSPFVPDFVDYGILNNIDCSKILVEFLRTNHWIERWFGDHIDISEYSVSQNGYRHLPLEKKIDLLRNITGFDEVSVCEDEDYAYEYWKTVNPNPNDCCNLRGVYGKDRKTTN